MPLSSKDLQTHTRIHRDSQGRTFQKVSARAYMYMNSKKKDRETDAQICG